MLPNFFLNLAVTPRLETWTRVVLSADAAQNDNGKLTEMLLKFGADASLKTDRDEVTPLHMAVSSNSYHAAFTLLKHGCDLEVTNSLGRTANSMQN